MGISQGLDIFTRIRETVAPPQPQIPQITEIQLTIQPYDVVTGYQGSPILRTLKVEQGTEIAAIAGSTVEQITYAIRPGSGSDYRANLEIKEGLLTSDKDLAGEAIVMNSCEQVPARVEIRDLARGSDLTRLFADPSTFDADCSCIHLELQVPADGYQNAALEIYQVGDGYSFDPSSPQAGKTLEFPVVPVSVLVEAPTGTGSDETTLGDAAARLNNSLRQQVNDSASLELSPYQSGVASSGSRAPPAPAGERRGPRGHGQVRHQEHLKACLDCLARARELLRPEPLWELVALELREAVRVLGELTGEEAGEDILDRIFGEFCIGK